VKERAIRIALRIQRQDARFGIVQMAVLSIILALLCPIKLQAQQPSQPAFALHAGDRVVFYGDSAPGLQWAGASIKEILELAGHKTITMSAHYSHLSPEHRLSVIDRIATVS
jgi:hypothetical protein